VAIRYDKVLPFEFQVQEDNMKQRNYTLIFCIVFLSLAFVVSGCGKKPLAEEAPMIVQVDKIQPGLLSTTFTYAGDVRGRYESQFAFQVAGRIQERLVNNGDPVKAGQTMMRIDVADLKTQLDSARANLVAAQADYTLNELTFKRAEYLVKGGAISISEFDTATAKFHVSTSNLRAAEAAFAAANQQYGYGNLTADADGVVAGIQVEAGQVVSIGQLAMTLLRTGEMEIQISVPEQRVEDVRKSRKAVVSFWALPNVELEGTIREISAQADSATRTYMVRVSIPQMPQVRYGMSAAVKIWTGDAAAASLIVLPAAAIYQTEGKPPSVWIVEKEALRLQAVKLGEFIKDGVVIQSGLKPGDTVVTAGVQKLREGQKVKIWDGRKI
jgi:membrane fusion protein, multidrug efflux system